MATTPALSVLFLGFLLGLRHATDADHLVAVTTIVARERRLWLSSLVGALWGLGHTVTIFVVGGSIVLFKIVIPARVGLGAELAVAVMLIALGAATLSRTLAGNELATPIAPAPALGAARPVVVGVVHGLAGSAAVALLVLSTLRGARWALFYLLVFGLGTVAGMMLLTTAIALPFAYSARRFERLRIWLARATGLASVSLGLLIAYRLIVAHGLFSSSPHWTPD